MQEQLRQGADFAALAREQSLDRTSAAKGGDMGFWQEEEAQHSGFVAELFRLQVGQVSEPYRNSQGTYHLIEAAEERYVSFASQKKMLRQALEKAAKKRSLGQILSRSENALWFFSRCTGIGRIATAGAIS